MILKAKMKDGTAVTIIHRNLDGVVPGKTFDDPPQTFEALTSVMECGGGFKCEGGWSTYAQLDKKFTVGRSDEIIFQMRLAKDYEALDREGVDLATIEDGDGPVSPPAIQFLPPGIIDEFVAARISQLGKKG